MIRPSNSISLRLYKAGCYCLYIQNYTCIALQVEIILTSFTTHCGSQEISTSQRSMSRGCNGITTNFSHSRFLCDVCRKRAIHVRYSSNVRPSENFTPRDVLNAFGESKSGHSIKTCSFNYQHALAGERK